ncbi:MAG: DNA repair and recombination protein RadA [Candidatus Heimdallarchaeota archaeon]
MAKQKKSKEELEESMKQVEEAMSFSLGDIEGIGPIRVKKLNTAGIYTAEDLIVRGSKELAGLLDMDTSVCAVMIESARRFLQGKDVVGKSTMSGRDLLNYRTKKIQFLETGAENLDEIIGNGYESGVITEFYGEFGCGKTQFCIVASVLAQLPAKRKCFQCLKVYDDYEVDRCPECNVKTQTIGGLSKPNQPCRVIYIDTENSYRPERMLQIIFERELVKVKERTPMEVKQGKDKQPLNDEERDKALAFLDNMEVINTSGSGHQMMVGEELGKMIKGEEGQSPVKLIIVDSIINDFRLDFTGRGEMGDRQDRLKKHIKHLSRLAEIHNIVMIITNQVMKSPTGFGDPTMPVGGMVLGHTSTHRIYLQKSGKKIVAKLVDSPNNAKNEAIINLTKNGIEDGE